MEYGKNIKIENENTFLYQFFAMSIKHEKRTKWKKLCVISVGFQHIPDMNSNGYNSCSRVHSKQKYGRNPQK